MYPLPLHTRFRISPSGQAHVGHWLLAKLSMEAARLTGGTFTMRCQQLWATRDHGSWDLYVKHAQENMDELQALGIRPSHPNVFLSHGMSPDWGVQLTDDRGLIDAYWHRLRLDELWGNWPNDPRLVMVTMTEPTACDYLSFALTQGASKHPYVQFAQMVGDVTTGRNCLIRGTDHTQDKAFADAFYPLIAKLHYNLPDFERQCEKTPCQFFMPRVERTDGDTISSSSGPASAGYYVRDIIEAGVPPDRLWKFMGRVLYGSYERADEMLVRFTQQVPFVPGEGWARGLSQEGVRSVMENIVQHPVIHAGEWSRLLRSGGELMP